jgi:hypothetical protein
VDQEPTSIELRPHTHSTAGIPENISTSNDIDIDNATTEIPPIPQDEEFTGFCIDTEPSNMTIDAPHPAPLPSHPDVAMAGPQIDDNDEIIVNVSPHSRSGV